MELEHGQMKRSFALVLLHIEGEVINLRVGGQNASVPVALWVNVTSSPRVGCWQSNHLGFSDLSVTQRPNL